MITKTNLLKDGDLVFFHTRCHWWKPSTWIAWRIQRDTQSQWEHVGILFYSMQKMEWSVIEAVGFAGVVIRPLAGRVEHVILDTKLTDSQLQRMIAHVWGNIGCHYDWFKVLKIRLLTLLVGARNVGRIMTQEDLRKGGFICSELVADALRAVGITVGSFASPGDIAVLFAPAAGTPAA